jgi:hypothetical protein
MKLPVIASTLMITVGAQALTVEQVSAIRHEIESAKRPELPFVASRLVKQAAIVDRAQVRSIVLRAVEKKHPGALKSVSGMLAENRPPTTPGNEHGQRPTVPPGPQNYGKP